MWRRPLRLRGSAVPRCSAYRSSIRLRSGPFSAPSSCRLRGPVSRVSPARACGRGGARFAAARFARVIARARRRAHVSPPLPPGSFSRPPAMRLRRKGKRAAPETALPSTPILAHFANSQALKRTKSEFFRVETKKLRRPFPPGFGYRQKQAVRAGPTGFIPAASILDSCLLIVMPGLVPLLSGLAIGRSRAGVLDARNGSCPLAFHRA